jgi:hypothetical protein
MIGFSAPLRRTGFVLLMTAVVAWPQAALAAPKDKANVFDFATGEPVAGAFAMLDRADDRVATKVRTHAAGGNAYTLWYVIFNAPEACSDGVCGEDDVLDFGDDNPFFPFNADQIEAARISVVWGNTGAVANAAGRLKLDGGLAVGEVPDGPQQILVGRAEDGALAGLSPVTGLEDAARAEIHLVVQDHGAAHDDPELLNMQLTQFEGACNPHCADVQYAVHLP